MNWPSTVTAAGLAIVLSIFGLNAFGGTSATAAPDPCAASEIAKTVGSVATNTGTYLDAHPQINQALTTIVGQPAGPQTLTAVKTYFDGNAQVGKDLQAIQQPLTELSVQCKLPISLPQLLGLLQAAQGAQSAGSQAHPGVVPTGTGPLPGPAPLVAR